MYSGVGGYQTVYRRSIKRALPYTRRVHTEQAPLLGVGAHDEPLGWLFSQDILTLCSNNVGSVCNSL